MADSTELGLFVVVPQSHSCYDNDHYRYSHNHPGVAFLQGITPYDLMTNLPPPRKGDSGRCQISVSNHINSWTMSHFGENVITRERSDRSNLFSQHNEIASPPSAARNDKCDIVEIVSLPHSEHEERPKALL
jgi:hypothetical protein